MRNLPEDATVGIMYNIGCQLDRSCKKWGFLLKYKDQIAFAISIFHVYGHQWPCQVVYNPCKCTGFGLTNGKGCEHL